MSDETIAAIGRNMAHALMKRARTRHTDEEKIVLLLQTQLCAAVREEEEQAKLRAIDD